MDFEKLVNENKLIRRLALLWAVVLITIVIVWTWLHPPNISGSTATALGVVVGLLSSVIGFYQWSRRQDDEACRKEAGNDHFDKNHDRSGCGPDDSLRAFVLEQREGHGSERESHG